MSPFRLIFASALAVALATDAPARGRIDVLRSDETGLELRLVCDAPELREVDGVGVTYRRPEWDGSLHMAEPGAPDVPTWIQLIGIPAGPLPTVRVVDVATGGVVALPDMAPAPELAVEGRGATARGVAIRKPAAFTKESSPAQWAELASESWLRGQRVARLELHPCRYHAATGQLEWVRELVVRVDFPRLAREGSSISRPDQAQWERTIEGMLPNASVAKAWRRPRANAALRGTADSFASAPTWVRVPIADAGIYRLDYFTFANLGVDPGAIDPRTVRVFSGRNLPLAENLLTSPPDAFMAECALKDLGDGDDVFDPTDRFLVYALGPDGWANEYDPSRSRTEFVENQHTDRTWYWLTWGGSFSSPPKRMTTRSVPDSTATDWPSATPHRLHYEFNRSEDFGYRDEDGWMWEDLKGRGNDRLYALDVDAPASGDGILLARLYSTETANFIQRSVRLKVQGQTTVTWDWIHTGQNAKQDVTGCFQGLLLDGPNDFRVDAIPDTGLARDYMYTGWFDLEYDRTLTARRGWLRFFTAPGPPVRALPAFGSSTCDSVPPGLVYGQHAFRILGFEAAPSEILLFDVTDQHDVVELKDFAIQNPSAPHNIRFSDPTVTGTRWYAATTLPAVKPLPTGRIASLRGLRDASNGTEYLVIYHRSFKEGAERLADIRDDYWGRAATMTVDVEDVYQEFGWGMKDPVAIRNFLLYTQESWANGAPLYVTLIGDAVFDTKPYLTGSPENLLPTFTGRYRENTVQYQATDIVDFYSTDDFFAYLDPEDYLASVQPSVDVAVGRYPISDPATLDIMLDKLGSYLEYRTPGAWQNRILLVADDERVLDNAVREPIHTQQVETLAQTRVPPAMDKVKVYLVNYPRDAFGKKPEAQADFIDEFSRGALMTTYTGHGDQNTMAQEEVFVGQRVGQLQNEERFGVFSTFSCTVSRFDLISGSSLTELLLEHPEGGAVTTFASGGLVFPPPSATLNQVWLGATYGTPYLISTFTRNPRPLGLAALAAKAIVGSNVGIRKNNEKYVLLGDPALEVRFGRHLVQFDRATVDSLATQGFLRKVSGQVVDSTGTALDGTNGTTPFNGTAFVHVSENADTTGYDYTDATGDRHINFVLEGPTAYRGEVAIVNGRFETLFFLNEGIQAGNTARVSVFALEDGPGRDGSGAFDSLVIAPTISASQVSDAEGPEISIQFEGYDRFVDGDQIFTDRPVVLVSLEDPSGVNLRPFPQFARFEAEIDGRDRIDLGEDFSYSKDSFTHGTVRRVLSVAPGDHVLAVKAFDNVENRSEKTVRFSVVLPGDKFDLVDQNVAVYPNPFRQEADFLFRLTHAADVQLKVFTIAGRLVREISHHGIGGDNVLRWDGRDEEGSPLANGTYLYKLEAERRDEEGNVEDDGFVGKVVRMR